MRACKQTIAGARAGFFLGDGAGVGKGRQIAALIKEYWLTRRKKAPKRVLWVSTSTDLRSGGGAGRWHASGLLQAVRCAIDVRGRRVRCLLAQQRVSGAEPLPLLLVHASCWLQV